MNTAIIICFIIFAFLILLSLFLVNIYLIFNKATHLTSRTIALLERSKYSKLRVRHSDRMMDYTSGRYSYTVGGKKYTFSRSYRNKKRGQIPKNLPIVYIDKAPCFQCEYKKGRLGDEYIAVSILCTICAFAVLCLVLLFLKMM